MRFKSLISLVAIACLLMVSINPLTARNTPFPESTRDNQAHPWQDDNQYVSPDDIALISIPVGPIVISIEVPLNWLGSKTSKATKETNTTKKTVRTSKPMSLNKKGEIR
ncbi:MAG: hypothetical protein IPH59_09090 [bacterium]|nr:hypothetical protein [bacterium]